MSNEQRYLIFLIEDGRMQDFGLYETRAAAEKRVAAMGLAASWKIAAINYWPEPVQAKRGRRR
jgi:hypothetical protein